MQFMKAVGDIGSFAACVSNSSNPFGVQKSGSKAKSQRTPLSSKARPFVSSQGGRQETSQPILIGCALVEQTMFAPSLFPMSHPHTVGLVSGPDYSTVAPHPQPSMPPLLENTNMRGGEQGQEDLHSDAEPFECEGLERGRGNELRRRDLWSAGLPEVTSRTPSPYGGIHSMCDSSGRWDGPTRTPSAPTDGDSQSLASENLSDFLDVNHDPGMGPNKTAPPVKHTFIHFDTSSSIDDDDMVSDKCLERSASAPGLLMENPVFCLVPTRPAEKVSPDQERSHFEGKCTPCAYYYRKQDSCRLGGDCKFCHLCPPEAMKKFKKQKMQEIRLKIYRERWMRKQRKAEKAKAKAALADGTA